MADFRGGQNPRSRGAKLPGNQQLPAAHHDWLGRVGVEQVVALKGGLYQIHAFLGKLESVSVNIEIKNGEVTSKIFHFGRESTK